MSKASLQHWMTLALHQAQIAFDAGEVPVGAIVECDGEIVSAAHNLVEALHDPSAHAELLAIKQATQRLGRKWLTDCRLFVTLEPCPMCAGAISHARLNTLVYGAYDPKSGGVDHGPLVLDHSQAHHKPEIISGILEEPCADLLKDFFSTKRKT